MVPQSNTVGALRVRRKRTKGPFKGVRMRKWGRWVSEIRVPQSRSRIWLGSFDNPEKAARAYDAALYCLRGPKGKFNFPNEKRPDLPDGLSTTFSKNDIKAVASRFASPNCTPATSSTSPAPSSTSSFASATSSPEVPNLGGEMESTWDLGDLHCAADLQEPEFFSPESFLLEEPIMLEPDCIWNMLEEANNFSNVE